MKSRAGKTTRKRSTAELKPQSLSIGEVRGVSGECYSRLRFFAKGGLGYVYEGVDRGGREVVLKFAYVGHERTLDWEFGVNQITRLDSSEYAEYLDWGFTRLNQRFLVFRRVRGRTLAETPISSLEDVLRLMAEVAESVGRLHGQGWVHCDLKPSNILIQADGTPVLIDLGVSTRAGEWKRGGTERYTPPESQVDATSDVYSLGCIFEKLIERLPADEQQRWISTPGSQEFLNRCTSWFREDRFGGIGEFCEALNRLSSAAARASVENLRWLADSEHEDWDRDQAWQEFCEIQRNFPDYRFADNSIGLEPETISEMLRTKLARAERASELLALWNFANRRSPADRRLVADFCERYSRHLLARGKTADGARHATVSLEIMEQLAKQTKTDQLELACRLNDLGAIYRVAGDPLRTVLCQIRALAIREMYLPKDSPLLATSWHDLAYSVRSVMHQPAVSMFVEAKRIWRKALGSSSLPVALVDSNLGLSLSRMGQNYWAYKVTESALQVTMSGKSDGHPHVATVSLSLSRQLIRQKEFDVAEGFLDEATRVRQQWYGHEAWETWEAIETGVLNAMERGDYHRAFRKLKGENLENWIWGGDPIQSRMLKELIDCCQKTGQRKDRQQAEVLQRSVTALFGRVTTRTIPYENVLEGAKAWLPTENREQIVEKIWKMARRDEMMRNRSWSREELLMN